MRSLSFLALLLFSPSVLSQTADFDTLVEGNFATTIADGGLTFSNLDNGLGGTQNFCPERADGTLTGMAGFTSPMVLGFTGYAPGAGAAFSRVVSFEISNGSTATQGRLEMYEFGSHAGNTITLEALSGTTVVSSHQITIPSGFAIHHYSFSVGLASPFDKLRVVGAGPTDGGAFFAVIDHVEMFGDGPATAFCFGDGTSGAACPCANTGAAGHGCDNSIASGGAELSASGPTSPDAVVMTSEDEIGGVASILLQGTAALSTPVPFGDGLRCVAGVLKRLYVENAVSGTATFPGPGDPSISQQSANLGDPIAPGSTRHYQVYYRDPDLGFCPGPAGNSWNVSNGVSLDW